MGRKRVSRAGEHRKHGTPHTCVECQSTYLSVAKTTRFCTRVCAARWLAKHRRTTTGRCLTPKGYVLIYQPTHPHATKAGYVMEHRLVMERIVGRYLTPNEVVHHRNGQKGDNSDSNLELMEKRTHDRIPKPPPHCVQIPCPCCKVPVFIWGRARLAAVHLSVEPPEFSRV